MLLYPAIDIREGRCVRLTQGDYARETVFSDDPAAFARRWVDEGAGQLHLVDLDGAKAGRPVNGAVVRAIVEAAQVPCQFGGGIRSEQDLRDVFSWGVERAILGSKALSSPEWVRDMITRYPGKIVLGLDARDGFVAVHGWLETSNVRAVELLQQLADRPPAAVVFTDIARDGTLAGPNFASLAEMQAASAIPVIASGGVGTLEDIVKLAECGTYACIVGKALYEGRVNLAEALQRITPRKV